MCVFDAKDILAPNGDFLLDEIRGMERVDKAYYKTLKIVLQMRENTAQAKWRNSCRISDMDQGSREAMQAILCPFAERLYSLLTFLQSIISDMLFHLWNGLIFLL